jgi:hypothetical protein
VRRLPPLRHALTGLRRALSGLVALVLLVTALGAAAHVHAAPVVGSGPVAVSSAHADDGSPSTGQEDGGDLACHGPRCACIGHGGARTDQEVRVASPALLRSAHDPIPHAPALISRRDAPPLQPPRA